VTDLLLEELTPVLDDPGRIIVFAFATAADSGVESAVAARTLLNHFSSRTSHLPIVFLSHGHTTGGGMLIVAVADLAIATSQSMFGLSVTLRQPLGVALVALRRRVRCHLIRRWVLLQEDIDASTALRSGLIEIITPTGEEHHFPCSLDQRLASESTVDSQMILPGVLATDTPTHSTQQL
jgi:enoyl-CoA hydratase/carnithine racemase